ncbi:beta-ketoacyl synthase [Patiriisocius marinistellae]|uniref:Beta-ketoacyl synthase n=2 Tax=Patiriisocius marinistellae TaxID=2494560 RepID=A0A5J4FUG3_9FLAO|nr:beta-ketoacyl synthase [Patiriisocius marinistellae]
MLIGEHTIKVSKISSEMQQALSKMQDENPAFKHLDRTVLLALMASETLNGAANFRSKRTGVNIGSSRGATGLFEKYYDQFKLDETVSVFTSPTTTLGNLSSSVAQFLGIQGVQIDQSVTCSTAMHALLNGIAWLQADMADAFIVGGSEAALTPFTIAQMKALRLYSTSQSKMACESMRFQKTKNTMILGEGSALAVLERGIKENALAVISGYGFASEALQHHSSISENADCFQKSMHMALENAGLKTVDAIVMHAPGTVKGDKAEKNAIDMIFGRQLPLLTSNKWMVGHTFATSGMLSLELATLMLEHNKFIENPFYGNSRHLPEQLKTVMVNAVGFGGNAVSIIILKPHF